MFNISIAQIGIWIWSNALYNSRGNQINIAQITILQLLFTNQMLVFGERGNPEYPGKNLWRQSTGPTNSIHIWHRVRKSNPGHIGGRQVLSPLCQPCSLIASLTCILTDQRDLLRISMTLNRYKWLAILNRKSWESRPLQGVKLVARQIYGIYPPLTSNWAMCVSGEHKHNE